ncbi:hypothetical protein [Prochlorococcus sp. MIT 1341]|nr:hypothetical protein [Prochlorococcus sp. MIT 1341]
MKVEGTLYQGSQTFKEVVVASIFDAAKKPALMCNPTAKVVAQNPVL